MSNKTERNALKKLAVTVLQDYPKSLERRIEALEQAAEPRQAREGWQVQRPDSEWDTEKHAESESRKYPYFADWRTWPAKRVAREGHEVKDPQSGAWYPETECSQELRVLVQGWETWKSRPIQEPEPGPSDPPPAAGPGLREAAKNLTDLLSEPEWATKEQMRLVSALETALTRADEDARLVQAVVEAGIDLCAWTELGEFESVIMSDFRTALDEMKAAREGAKHDHQRTV